MHKEYKNRGNLIPFLKRLSKFAFAYPAWVYGFIFCVLLVAAVEAFFPIVWMKLLDTVIVPVIENKLKYNITTGNELNQILFYGIVLFAMGIIVSISVYGFIIFAGKIQENVMYDIRQLLFKKLQSLSLSFFDKSATGWLLSRITSDTIKVTELISWGMLEALWGMGMILFCVIYMFIFSWKLAIIVTITIPVLVLFSVKIRLLILKFSREARKLNSDITASFNEHINGIEVNKSLVQEERVSEEFNKLSDKMKMASYKSAYYSALYMPIIIFGGSISAVLVIYFGGKMSLSIPPEITIGTLSAFFGYATLMYEPILDISRFYSQAQNSISAGERIFSLLDKKPIIIDSLNSDNYSELRGDIEFENVSFSYNGINYVLNDFNLKIKAGESIALVGETGGGKSTIINLICRFYEPDSGKIKIDSVDIKSKTIHSLRKQFGVVLQTPHLFSGTIRDNIKYGNENISDSEIVAALKKLGGEELIHRLNEQVGEGGELLSTGEKQLISFARVIVINPRIFILDEATSSIDTLTEAKIQTGIADIIKNRTSIIIAHRLSTIKSCDRILLISNGKITECGSHKELILKRGQYYELYTRQLSEQKEKEIMNSPN